MNDLLKQGRDRADRVPDERSKLGKVFSLLAERIQSVVALIRELEGVDLRNDAFLDLFANAVIVEEALRRRLLGLVILLLGRHAVNS